MSVLFYILLTIVGGAALIVFFFCPFVGMIVMSNERTDASKKAVLEDECHTYYPVVLKRTNFCSDTFPDRSDHRRRRSGICRDKILRARA